MRERIYRPTPAQLSAMVGRIPKPKVRPRLTDEGGFYCSGSGVMAQGDDVRQAYVRWVARIWHALVRGLILSRRVKL